MNYNSSHDMLALVADVNLRRLPRVLGEIAKRDMGLSLRGMANVTRVLATLTEADMKAYKIARELHWRYERGDYRHTGPELSHLLHLCRFLIRRHAQLHNSKPSPFEPSLGLMKTAIPLGPGTYQAVCDAISEGKI